FSHSPLPVVFLKSSSPSTSTPTGRLSSSTRPRTWLPLPASSRRTRSSPTHTTSATPSATRSLPTSSRPATRPSSRRLSTRLFTGSRAHRRRQRRSTRRSRRSSRPLPTPSCSSYTVRDMYH
ncbi:hypothetical protein HWV62_8631, partial [Athelia sp. TMB]